MFNVLTIAARNLARFRRRTLLTSTLITLGIIAVLLFIALAGSFKTMMVGQFTDALLGHVQVHRQGYVASIDTLPLNLNMPSNVVDEVERTLKSSPAVEAYSPRIKIGAMFSNFTETTSIRLSGIDPEKEASTTPLLPGRVLDRRSSTFVLERGQILIPTLLARGMNVAVGDTVVLVATNREGSVNGKTFTVAAVMESLAGPTGRDGYIRIEDARELLRMKQAEVSEIAVRLKEPAKLDAAHAQLKKDLAQIAGSEGKPALEVHTWADLSPFSTIARMIDLMNLFIKVMLVSIVLISVMNVMIMAVYERVREIGTISAIGTPPHRILGLFLGEGLLLAIGGTAIGTAISLAAIYALNVWKISFSFAMQQNLQLSPSVTPGDVIGVAVVVILVALLASLQPAWKASRMDPVKALNHV